MVNNSTNISKTIQVLCDKVYQWLAAGWWFSLSTLVSSTNKTDCHNITEILMKVALKTITLNKGEFQWVIEHQLSNFATISWWEQVNFQWDDDDKVCFILDQQAKLGFYSGISLKQQSTGRHVTPLGHIILILSQPVFTLSH